MSTYGLPNPKAQLPLTLLIGQPPARGTDLSRLVRIAIIEQGYNCEFSIPKSYEMKNGELIAIVQGIVLLYPIPLHPEEEDEGD